MLRTYIVTALRHLKKDKPYSVINLAGLSVGIACCLVVFLFVRNEFGYDRFHKNGREIYRLTTGETGENGRRTFAHSYIPMAPLLQSQFAGIKEVTRFFPYSAAVSNKKRNVAFQEEKFCFADSNFFRVFSFGLKQGNVQTALSNPQNVILSEEAATRYFGTADPIGEELVVDGKTAFKVAGVLPKTPSGSSIRFDLLVPFKNAATVMGSWLNTPGKTWHFPTVYTFVQVEGDAASDIQARMKDFETKFLPEAVSRSRSHTLQPLAEMHFSSLENELHPVMNKKVLYLFIAIAALILTIAAANHSNLFLSKILQRIRGVGIRKVMGANSRNIWGQTAVECGLLLLVSLLFALLWIRLSLPAFNAVMDMQLRFSDLLSTSILPVVLLVIGTLSLLLALFPAMLLSRFKVMAVLKGEAGSLFPRRKTFSLQSGFVVFQFVIAILLIVSTLVIQSQLDYIRKKDLGLRKDQMLVVPLRDERMQNDYAALKNSLSNVSGVTKVSAISNFPWAKGFYDFTTTLETEGRRMESNAYTLLVDEDFIEAMGMTMVKGRAFSKSYGKDASSAFIINETAARKFNISSVGNVKVVMNNVASGRPKGGELIGVVRDFHLQSLHQPVDPLILTVSPEPYYIDNLVLHISTGDVAATLKNIEQEMKTLAPGTPFDYFFLDDAFDQLYKKEVRLGSLFNYFSLLAIIISCLGLFGISAFSAVQRAKEVGIRKVLGASVRGLVALLSTSFLRLVVIASLVAFPVAWWVMNKWLNDFAYRITIGWRVFAFAGAAALLVAFATVGFHTLKAARANPVKSLRTE